LALGVKLTRCAETLFVVGEFLQVVVNVASTRAMSFRAALNFAPTISSKIFDRIESLLAVPVPPHCDQREFAN
jgi:hypothetical protein